MLCTFYSWVLIPLISFNIFNRLFWQRKSLHLRVRNITFRCINSRTEKGFMKITWCSENTNVVFFNEVITFGLLRTTARHIWLNTVLQKSWSHNFYSLEPEEDEEWDEEGEEREAEAGHGHQVDRLVELQDRWELVKIIACRNQSFRGFHPFMTFALRMRTGADGIQGTSKKPFPDCVK